MLDQDDNFDRINLSILITYLLDNIYIDIYIYIYKRKVVCQSLLGVKGLS